MYHFASLLELHQPRALRSRGQSQKAKKRKSKARARLWRKGAGSFSVCIFFHTPQTTPYLLLTNQVRKGGKIKL